MAGALLQRISSQGQRILSSPPFTKYLLLTNVVTGGVIDLCGDLIAQKVVEKSASTDWKRTGRMITVSMVFSVPCHFWYIFLEKLLPLRTGKHIFKKVMLDTFIAGPFFLSGFYVGMSTLEGCTWKQSVEELRRKFIPTFMVEVCFWPLVQAVNFYFLPISLRLVCINATYLVWSVFLSTCKHNEIKLPLQSLKK